MLGREQNPSPQLFLQIAGEKQLKRLKKIKGKKAKSMLMAAFKKQTTLECSVHWGS